MVLTTVIAAKTIRIMIHKSMNTVETIENARYVLACYQNKITNFRFLKIGSSRLVQ